MRCPCTACLLRAALVLLRTGQARMAVLLLEQTLAAEEARAKPRPRRGRRARP
jgi:hypothetical protein